MNKPIEECSRKEILEKIASKQDWGTLRILKMADKHTTPIKQKLTNQMFPERSATVAKLLEKKTHYPWVRLRGMWLEKAGFSPKTKVRIRVMKDCLVITKDLR